ncbi:MAG: glycosyltransferase family 2 protein [Flavobacteriaceae bacterium TMED238]|nr:MAG: glycosyltransferase family 2 protein [Flavobacteriaceae bacterium TMED238]
MNNLVSVIMSAYNAEESLGSSIESILNQSYKNLELLIMDDGSSDSTNQICKRYEKEYASIRVYENLKNIGLTKSLNTLISHANGTLIARQDADDFSTTKRIEKQIHYLQGNNLDACTTRALIIKNNKKIPRFSHYLPARFVIKKKNPFIHGTLLIKKSVIEKLGFYDERFLYAQDYKLFSDLFKAGFNIKTINECLYHLNTENNISSNYSQAQTYYAKCVQSNTSPDPQNI